MLEWLKSLWAKWKVQISFVGGALVIATTYAQCTVEPNVEAIEDAAEVEPASTETTTETTDVTTVETTTGTATPAEDATATETTENTD